MASELQSEYSYQLSVEYIDGDPVLEKEYGEKIPVIMINGQPHDIGGLIELDLLKL